MLQLGMDVDHGGRMGETHRDSSDFLSGCSYALLRVLWLPDGIQISNRHSHLRVRLPGPVHHFQKLTMFREGATDAWNDRIFYSLGNLIRWLWNCVP